MSPIPRNSTSKKPVKYCCAGLLIDMVHMLAKDLGVHFDLYLVEDDHFGSFDRVTGQWNGMVKDLIDRNADMALAPMDINVARMTAIDFSQPFFVSELKILVSSTQAENASNIFGFLGPFDGYLWIALLVIVNVVLVVIWFLEKISRYGHHRTDPERRRFGIAVCMSYVWSTVFKLTLDDITPKSFSARLTSAAFSFATLIIATSYTANLAASIVTFDIQLPITGIRDPKVIPPTSLPPRANPCGFLYIFFSGRLQIPLPRPRPGLYSYYLFRVAVKK